MNSFIKFLFILLAVFFINLGAVGVFCGGVFINEGFQTIFFIVGGLFSTSLGVWIFYKIFSKPPAKTTEVSKSSESK